jgi:hypothetical protein
VEVLLPDRLPAALSPDTFFTEVSRDFWGAEDLPVADPVDLTSAAPVDLLSDTVLLLSVFTVLFVAACCVEDLPVEYSAGWFADVRRVPVPDTLEPLPEEDLPLSAPVDL